MENQRVPCGSGIVGSDQKVAVPLEGSVWCAIYVFAQLLGRFRTGAGGASDFWGNNGSG